MGGEQSKCSNFSLLFNKIIIICSNKSDNNHTLIRDSEAPLIIIWHFMSIELVLKISYVYKHINEVNKYINVC